MALSPKLRLCSDQSIPTSCFTEVELHHLQLRAANLRHQRSEEGRLDHRDRQRAYRRRLAADSYSSAAKSVTDHGSNHHHSYGAVCAAQRDDSDLREGSLSIPTSGTICQDLGQARAGAD
jgi:glutamate synthase domain-containing protein 3